MYISFSIDNLEYNIMNNLIEYDCLKSSVETP